jgi:hypothetical protein
MTKIKHRDYFFEDTVIDFYHYSNEVDDFFNVFKTHIIQKIGADIKSLNWLDVGIGNGEKILRLLPLFTYKPNITFIEPSNRWVNELTISGNFDKLKTITEIKGFHRTFEDFADHRTDFSFDFISFIQVLYESDLVNSLFEFIDSKRNKSPFYLLINLENEENDFYKIRKSLFHEGIQVPISQIAIIEKAFNHRNLDFIKFPSIAKSLYLEKSDIINSENHWFIPLILGCSKQEFSELDQKKRRFITSTIFSLLSKQNNLDICDTTYLSLIK